MAVGGAPIAEVEDGDCQSVLSDVPASFSLTVHNCSEPETKEFHDVLQPGWGPRISSILLCLEDTPSNRNITEVLEELRKTDGNARAAVFQNVIAHMIPKLSEDLKLCDLTECVLDSNRDVQEVAITWLETTMLKLQYSDDPTTVDGLMTVASSALAAFLKQIESDQQAYTLLYLHLLAVSALLSRCDHFQTDQLSPFWGALKQHKKRKETPLKQKAVDGLKTFYEYFKHQTKSTQPFPTPDWATIDWGRKDNHRSNEIFKFCSFCQHVVKVYTLFSEILHQGRSPLGRTLLEVQRELFLTFSRARKYRGCEEVLDFMIIRCLNILLRHRFARDVTPFGKIGLRDHNDLIVDTMLKIMGDEDKDHKRLLTQEVKQLPFHNSLIVRQSFNCYLSGKSKESPIEFFKRAFISFLETNLRLIGFQRDRTGSTERAAADAQEACSWLEITCVVGDVPAEGAVFLPKPSCLSKSAYDLLMCITGHPGKAEMSTERKQQIIQKAQRHMCSLDNLKLLSIGCRNIINLLAYQIKPFPFYITEALEDCCLLEFLIDHRNVQQWLSNQVLVQIIQDVVSGLIYISKRRMVTRDVTAYSMIVEMHEDRPYSLRESASRILSPGNFVVKIADLGLAFRLPDGSDKAKVSDKQPVPLRWTPAEALFDDMFSEKSMVYSLAFFIYECWTHGCQPFTDYDKDMQTKDIVHLFHLQRTKPCRRVKLQRCPCIPEGVFSLMENCAHHKPSLRPSLLDVLEQLEILDLPEESDGDVELELHSAIRCTKEYPALGESQIERRHIPEMGTSEIFHKETLV